MNDDFGYYYQLCTFVDITHTNVRRGFSKARNQQRNLDTLIQAIGMITQPNIVEYPTSYFKSKAMLTSNAARNKIGALHKFDEALIHEEGHAVWTMLFSVQHAEVFGHNNERLYSILDNIPVVSGLDETIQLTPSIFSTSNMETMNIMISLVRIGNKSGYFGNLDKYI